MVVDSVKDTEATIEHELTADREDACCRLKTVDTDAVIDCRACIEAAFNAFVHALSEPQRAFLDHFWNAVRSSGQEGMDHRRFKVCDYGGLLFIIDTEKYFITKDWFKANSLHEGTALIQQLLDLPVPPILWVGYSKSVLVDASSYARSWAVLVSGETITRVFPRRWLDISGNPLPNLWSAAIRAVLGVIHGRPGISQVRELVLTARTAPADLRLT
jgi:oxalate---CoA ligase